MKKILFFSACLLTSLSLAPLQAEYLFKNGKLIDMKDVADLPIEEHFKKGVQALKAKDWNEAVHQFRVVTISFPDAELTQEGHYYLGSSYYHAGDMDLANNSLSTYLKNPNNLKYFEQTFRYKLAIADAFKNGAKKHLFGYEKMPQLFSAQENALIIYDEIITALPNHEITTKALFSKGSLLFEEQNFRASRDAYQLVIKKFPKSELASASFVKIAEGLLKQSKAEFQNPDLLSLAELNLKKLKQNFPRAEKHIERSQKLLFDMQETFASGLYETGALYERKKQPKASLLYYDSTVAQFPATKSAELSRERIKALNSYAKELGLTP